MSGLFERFAVANAADSSCGGHQTFHDGSKLLLIIPATHNAFAASLTHHSHFLCVVEKPAECLSNTARVCWITSQPVSRFHIHFIPLLRISDQESETACQVLEWLVRGARHRLLIKIAAAIR